MEEESVGQAITSVSEELAEDTKNLFHIGSFKDLITWHNIILTAMVVLTIIIFYIIYRIIKRQIIRRAQKKLEKHTAIMINKIVSYVFYVLMVMYILHFFGINLSAIWGAAGVAGLAIGFAAQTSVSNIISGVFVLLEKSLRIGDYIEVDGVSGTVNNIQLLSITITTPDNQMIRIPNSSIINTNLINYSHFPTRRITLGLALNYDCDMQKALDAATLIAPRCKTAIQEPKPLIYYEGINNAIELKICIWINSKDLFDAKTEILMQTISVFREHNIPIVHTSYDVRFTQDTILQSQKVLAEPAKKSAKATSAKKTTAKKAAL